MLIVIGPAVRGLLTSSQLRKLPYSVTASMDKQMLLSLRNGTPLYAARSGMGIGGPIGAPIAIGAESMVIVR
jgi:hypothetical protein